MNQSSLHAHFPLIKAPQKRFRPEEEETLKKTLKLEHSVQTFKLRSLITPIPAIPSLSLSTKEVIDSLKPQKITSTVEEILTSIPAKKKYAELIDPLRGFPLPYSYRKLVLYLDALDKALSYCFMVNQTPNFEFLSYFMQEKYRQTFCADILGQIQAIIEAYSIDWDGVSKESLVLTFPDRKEATAEQLSVRRSLLHSKLLTMTQKYHEEFCCQKGVELPASAWHPDFDLNSVPPIVPRALGVRSIVNSELLARNASLESVFKDMAIPKLQESVQVQVLDRRRDCERICKVCESLKIMFTNTKTPSIFFVNLCKKLKDSRFEENVDKDVLYICEILPQWVSLIQTNSGKVVRFNRQSGLTLKMIVEEVHKSFGIN